MRKALQTIYDNNCQKFLNGKCGAVNGFVTGRRGKIDTTAIQSMEVWPGVTFGLASLMIYEGTLFAILGWKSSLRILVNNLDAKLVIVGNISSFTIIKTIIKFIKTDIKSLKDKVKSLKNFRLLYKYFRYARTGIRHGRWSTQHID